MTVVIIFYILLVTLVVFLNYKVFMLRRGKIEIDTIHHDRARKIKVLKQVLKFLAHKLKDWLKEGLIKFAAWRIRAKARTNYFIEMRMPWLYTLLQKRPEIEHKHAKNIFWRGVIEYKYKIQRLKAEILEEESQKISDKIAAKEALKDEVIAEQKILEQEIKQELEQELPEQKPLKEGVETLNKDIEIKTNVQPDALPDIKIKKTNARSKIEALKITDKDTIKPKKKRLFF